MLRAIGMTRSECYLASLAVTRPPGGRCDEEAAADPDVDVRLPLGAFGFEVHGVAPGGSAEVRVALPRGTGADAYYKIDPATGSPVKFDFDGTTGAVIDGDVENGSLMAGQSVGMVSEEESAAAIVASLVQQAEAALHARG